MEYIARTIKLNHRFIYIEHFIIGAKKEIKLYYLHPLRVHVYPSTTSHPYRKDLQEKKKWEKYSIMQIAFS